jgi:hypothetical protein
MTRHKAFTRRAAENGTGGVLVFCCCCCWRCSDDTAYADNSRRQDTSRSICSHSTTRRSAFTGWLAGTSNRGIVVFCFLLDTVLLLLRQR